MQDIKLRIWLLLLGVLVIVTITGCSSDRADDEMLTRSKWGLIEYRLSGTLHSSIGTATITFENELRTVSGSTGCNTYGGDYSVSGDLMSIGQVASTERACIDPPGVMDQEAAFLQILSGVTRFEIGNGQLRLFSPDGELVFVVTTLRARL